MSRWLGTVCPKSLIPDESINESKFSLLSTGKFFEVTTQVPYLTVGPIEAIGYHPSTLKSEHPAECEKIYQDHLAEQYSDENAEYSEESLEMARMPLGPDVKAPPSSELRLEGEDGEII